MHSLTVQFHADCAILSSADYCCAHPTLTVSPCPSGALQVTFFERRQSREVLSLMARMLQMNVDEQRKVGLLGSTPQRTGILARVTGAPLSLVRVAGGLLGNSTPPSPGGPMMHSGVAAADGSDSFADQWVRFLLAQGEGDGVPPGSSGFLASAPTAMSSSEAFMLRRNSQPDGSSLPSSQQSSISQYAAPGPHFASPHPLRHASGSFGASPPAYGTVEGSPGTVAGGTYTGLSGYPPPTARISDSGGLQGPVGLGNASHRPGPDLYSYNLPSTFDHGMTEHRFEGSQARLIGSHVQNEDDGVQIQGQQ